MFQGKDKAIYFTQRRKDVKKNAKRLGEPLRIHPPTPQMGGYPVKESHQEYGFKNMEFPV
jgi:hypothetical protein